MEPVKNTETLRDFEDELDAFFLNGCSECSKAKGSKQCCKTKK